MITSSDTSFRYRIDQDIGVALTRLSGPVDGAFIAECAGTLQSDPAWSYSYAAIWDERGISVLDVTPGDLDKMVEAQAEGAIGPDIVLTARDDHALILELYAWRVNARGRPALVCETLDEALDELEINELPDHLTQIIPGET